MGRQKELNIRQRQKHTNAIQDIRREVTTIEGKKLTIQQVICSLTDSNHQKIFTGAERMGETERVLITFDKDNGGIAREVIDNIAQALESVTMAVDHALIANEGKMPSRETTARQRTSNHQYMETILAE